MKIDIKLACKTIFIRFSTSGGRPMLLVRPKTDKKTCEQKLLSDSNSQGGENRMKIDVKLACKTIFI